MSDVSQPIRVYLVAALSVFAAGISTLGYGLSAFILAGDGKLLEQLQAGDSAPIDLAIPIAAGIAALQVVHEIGHLVAARAGNLKTGVPIVIPSLQLGTFGAITPLLAFPKTRTQLFDFAFAGPAVSAVLSLAVYAVGLGMSGGLPATPPPDALSPVLPTGLLQSSLLLGSMAELFLPGYGAADGERPPRAATATQPLAAHPAHPRRATA